jgi:hypothetical protein
MDLYDPQAELDALFHEMFGEPFLVDGVCRVCGCTDPAPRNVGLGWYWVEPDLCSRCHEMGHR